MILKEINFSTGPVALHEHVKQALVEDPISHRSQEFQQLVERLSGLYKDEFLVNNVYFLTGSGTTANEAMLHQVKMLNKPGLILANGEFGNRLIKQSATIGLQFSVYKKAYGETFLTDEIEALLRQGNIGWVLFTHCETSTGIINNLEQIAALCKKYKVLCFVDCISSVAAFKIDLSQVAMATASSGKGLSAIPGIALVLSNIETGSDGTIPVSLDLTNYGCGRIPFTISSNLIKALYAGSKLKLTNQSYETTREASQQITQLFDYYRLKTFNARSHVFTIISTHHDDTNSLANNLLHHRLITSFKSEYLQKNNWLQVALFGIYTNREMQEGIDRIQSLLSCKVVSQVHF